MSDREAQSDRRDGGSRGGSVASDQSHDGDRKIVTYQSRSRSKDRSESRSPSVHKSKKRYSRSRSRSRSHHKSSRKSSRYRSRSPSTRRYRSRYSRSRSDSRSRSQSYSSSYRRRRSHSRSPMSNRRRHKGSRDNPQPSRCLGVFGLSLCTTEQQLRHIFGKYGPVDTVQVIIDAKTGRSRGFGFVYYESYEDARVAKDHCTGLEIDGRKIRVDFSITDRAHTPTPGIYMGKPTYNDDHYGGRDRDRDRGGRDRGYDDYYGGSGGSYRGGGRSSYRSPSPYYSSSRSRRSRYDRSRSRSYSPNPTKRSDSLNTERTGAKNFSPLPTGGGPAGGGFFRLPLESGF